MKWLKKVGFVLLGLVTLVILMAIVGLLIPEGHVATSSAHIDQPPEAVWEAITDFYRNPSWRSSVDRVERLPDHEGHPVWREHGPTGPLTLEIIELTPPERMVARIADPELPFGGSWTYRVTPEEGGSRVELTEDGEIYNPLFRFMARFVFDYNATMETYLEDLGRRFGEDVTEIDSVWSHCPAA